MTSWVTKQVNSSSAGHEIKHLTQFNKVIDIYMNICNIGREIEKLQRAGKDITNTVQKQAADNLPFAEELLSAGIPDSRTIKDFVDFISPPDILLEDELCWPVKP